MSSNKNSSAAIFTLIILALAGISGYLLYNKYQKEKTILEQEQVLLEQEKLNFELNSKVDKMVLELEQVQSDNVQLNEVVANQKTELALQKDKIAGLIRNKKDLSKARAELDELETVLSSYRAQISQLQNEVNELTESNMALQNTNQKLNENIVEVQEENQSLVTAKGMLESEKETLTKVNKSLAGDVNRASTIQADVTDLHGVRFRSNGNTAKTNKASKMSGIQVCLLLADNALVDEAEETFYLRLISPNGETVTDNTDQIINLAGQASELRYSSKYTINYAGAGEECMLYEPGLPLTPGEYLVEVYNKGHLSAQGSYVAK